ncbi:hypothetical protein ACLEEZ_05540 [Lonsdalea quercina]|jgi:hypothetical protein|uniref:hypothetical protein n=1 Tax=Lonsdalea quercina TaxID=71657 RepID=UPI0039769A04
MKKNLLASLILGGAFVLSAAIVAGGIQIKDEHVLLGVDGNVKLGDVLGEEDQVSAKLIFNDSDLNQVLFEKVGPSEAEGRLYEKLKELSDQVNLGKNDDEKKTAPEKLSLKVPATLVLTAAVKYRSEYQPVFTFSIAKEEVKLPAESNMLEAIKPAVTGFIQKQKNNFDSSHFLK